jgi:hypothetical protein
MFWINANIRQTFDLREDRPLIPTLIALFHGTACQNRTNLQIFLPKGLPSRMGDSVSGILRNESRIFIGTPVEHNVPRVMGKRVATVFRKFVNMKGLIKKEDNEPSGDETNQNGLDVDDDDEEDPGDDDSDNDDDDDDEASLKVSLYKELKKEIVSVRPTTLVEGVQTKITFTYTHGRFDRYNHGYCQ